MRKSTSSARERCLTSGILALTFAWDMMQYFVVIMGCYIVMLMYNATALCWICKRIHLRQLLL